MTHQLRCGDPLHHKRVPGHAGPWSYWHTLEPPLRTPRGWGTPVGGLTNLILVVEVTLHILAFVAFVTNAFGGVGLVGLAGLAGLAVLAVAALVVVVVAAAAVVVFVVEVSI